jgi:signal transduction histidine kinase
MFRCKKRDLLGKNLSSLLPALVEALPGEAEADVAVSAVLTRLVGHRQESVANRKDGTKFPVDIAMSRVDHLQLYTAILRDLTVRKQLQAHILEIATEEQTRIGQELHDGTQQELAGLALFAGAIHECLENATCQSHPATDPEYCLVQRAELQRAKELLAKLQQGLQQSSLNVQTLAHGILPVQVDARGLNAALTELAASANHPGKIDCQVEFLGTGTITNNAVATQLYRIAQESLHNSLKHGRADKIRISLFQSATQVLLEIQDNGTGIDLGAMPRSSGKRQGFGLRIMSYRASILGGELQVLRNEGRGTTVRCSIPTLERIP